MNPTEIFTTILNQTAAILGNSYGLAIIVVTIAIRSILLPLLLPSMKSQKKMVELKPKIDELKAKHGKNKEVFAKKQMELYQQHGINPLGGCLPQLVQIGLFIVFYRVLVQSLEGAQTLVGNTNFLWLDLTQPDKTFVLPVLAGLTQFILGAMLVPATDTTAEKKLASQTKTSTDDKEAIDADAMAKTMQSQMMFVMPIVTVFFSLKFPSGLALYWVTSTIYSLVQQYLVSGLGGLTPYLKRFGIIK